MENEVLFNDLKKQWDVIKDNALGRISNLFDSSSFINGGDVSIFENNFAHYIGSKYAAGVSNGTDAIKLCVQAIDPKGKVGIIIPANTFIATLLGAEMACPNAEFVLIDCNKYYQMDLNILEDVLKNRRHEWDECIILPVHLYGHPCDILSILLLSEEFDCQIIEDSSQAHGTTVSGGQKAGYYGHMSAFSMYPGKNLGAAGDAGVITTSDEELYNSVQLLKNWGSEEKYYYKRKGYNNRLDSIQAIIVDEKLKHLDDWNSNRIIVAELYNNKLNPEIMVTPKTAEYCEDHTYHIYPVRILSGDRESFMTHLQEKGVQCGIHYPVPIELTNPYKNMGWDNPLTREYAKQLVSLPIHPFMSNDDIKKAIAVANSYNYKKSFV